VTRKPLIAGNWKMNLNHFEAIALVQKIAFSLPDKYYDRVDVSVIPPFTDLRSVQTLVDGDKLRLTYGAQDLSQHDSGAYTGEISGAFLAKLGCSYVVVGHSERRTYHGEDDALVAAKAAAALKYELTPIICIGEHLEVREAGEHIAHCQEQLRGSVAGLSAEQIAKVVIAYEPVWAIGTGRVTSSRRRTSTALWSAARRWTASSSRRCLRSPPEDHFRSPWGGRGCWGVSSCASAKSRLA
jgi:triosephosphate isomerase